MMKRATAARYCDLSPVEFEREVASGRLPMPVRLGNNEHWDRIAIDDDLNRLSGRARSWEDEQPGLAA
jgi:hypothetical protein